MLLGALAACAGPLAEGTRVGGAPTARAADPAAVTPPLAYQPVRTMDFAPVAPLDWAERNRGVTPMP